MKAWAAMTMADGGRGPRKAALQDGSSVTTMSAIAAAAMTAGKSHIDEIALNVGGSRRQLTPF